MLLRHCAVTVTIGTHFSRAGSKYDWSSPYENGTDHNIVTLHTCTLSTQFSEVRSTIFSLRIHPFPFLQVKVVEVLTSRCVGADSPDTLMFAFAGNTKILFARLINDSTFVQVNGLK